MGHIRIILQTNRLFHLYRNLKEALKHQDAYLTRIAMLTSEKEGIKIFKREAPFCCYNGSDFNGSKRC